MPHEGISPWVAVVVGVLLVASPLYMFPHAGEDEHLHLVEQISSEDIPADETVIAYESLSASAKAAFDNARENEGSVTKTYGQDTDPPEFIYVDESQYYYIKDGGQFYRLETMMGSLEPTIQRFLEVGMVLLGFVIGGIGIHATRSPRPRRSIAFALYGGLVLTVPTYGFAPGPFGDEDLGLVLIIFGLLAGFAVGMGRWVRSIRRGIDG